MNPQLLSISRRTDIPAFYGDWLMRRIDAGFAGWENPFGGQRHLVSLRREEVRCLAFWSKNFRPFLPHLRTLQTLGFPCFFNYTITGLPSVFETHTVPADDAIDSLRELARGFSPEHIHWRYDPIVLSNLTPPEYHRARFAALAAALEGHVTRCIVSFVWRYSKVERSFAALEAAHGLRIDAPDLPARRALAQELAAIAARHGMELCSCCGDDLVSNFPPADAAAQDRPRRRPRPRLFECEDDDEDRFAEDEDDPGKTLPGTGHCAPNRRIRRAHCLDGERIARLYPGPPCPRAPHPNRPQCGCAQNVDIGRYDTCPHGCAYCYANAAAARARASFQAHDPAAAFLGCTKADSDRFVAELQIEAAKKALDRQMELPLDSVE